MLIEEFVAVGFPIITGTKTLFDNAYMYAGFLILSTDISTGFSDEILKLEFIFGLFILLCTLGTWILPLFWAITEGIDLIELMAPPAASNEFFKLKDYFLGIV